jgi:hypothetical protein
MLRALGDTATAVKVFAGLLMLDEVPPHPMLNINNGKARIRTRA